MNLAYPVACPSVGRMSEALSAECATDTWRKALRFSALRLLPIIGQTIYLSRHIKEEE